MCLRDKIAVSGGGGGDNSQPELVPDVDARGIAGLKHPDQIRRCEDQHRPAQEDDGARLPAWQTQNVY